CLQCRGGLHVEAPRGVVESPAVFEVDVDAAQRGRVQFGKRQVFAPLRQRAVEVDVGEVGQRLGVDQLVVRLDRGARAHQPHVAVGNRQGEYQQARVDVGQ